MSGESQCWSCRTGRRWEWRAGRSPRRSRTAGANPRRSSDHECVVMLPSTNLVDLTVDDGYATADDDTIPSAPDAPHPGAPDDQHHGATPSDISEESYDGSTMLLPPKEPTTNDLLRALLTASSATNLLLTQLLSGERPDNGRPRLVQPRRQPPAPEVPRDPDFFGDGRPRTSKHPSSTVRSTKWGAGSIVSRNFL